MIYLQSGSCGINLGKEMNSFNFFFPIYSTHAVAEVSYESGSARPSMCLSVFIEKFQKYVVSFFIFCMTLESRKVRKVTA